MERLAVNIAGPYVVACVVLGLAGGMKLVDPDPTRGALRAMGLPWAGPVVLAIGTGEIAAATVALVAGGTLPAALIAFAYLSFAVFVAVALDRRTPLASCGCLGRQDTPPTPIHLGIDVVFTLIAVAASIGDVPSIDRIVSHQPAAGIPFLAYVGLGVALTVLALTSLPRTLALTTPREAGRT